MTHLDNIFQVMGDEYLDDEAQIMSKNPRQETTRDVFDIGVWQTGSQDEEITISQTR